MSYIIKVKDTNGNWIGIPALKGVDGITPHIGENGNWFIGGEDTGVAAGGLTELPMASADTLGGVKVGDNLTIDENGVLNGKDVDLTSYAQKSELPTKVSDLTNDSLFITNTVNNLTNYYTKTETYTQEQINNLISAAASLKLEVVSVLPTTDISTSTIYLKGTETTGTNDYEEWIYVNNNWELIGTTAIDLTPYATKDYVTEQIDAIPEVDLTGYATKEDYYQSFGLFSSGTILKNRYRDVLNNWQITSTKTDGTDTQTESVYNFVYNKLFNSLAPVLKGTKTTEAVLASLQQYTYASAGSYTSNTGTTFSGLQQIKDIFGPLCPCQHYEYIFNFGTDSMLNTFMFYMRFGTKVATMRVQLGRVISVTCQDESDYATAEYVDNGIQNLMPANTIIIPNGITITETATPIRDIFPSFLDAGGNIYFAPQGISFLGMSSYQSAWISVFAYAPNVLYEISGFGYHSITGSVDTGTGSDGTSTGDANMANGILECFTISYDDITGQWSNLKVYDYVNTGNVLTKDNHSEYVPTLDYHPATKKYVDDSIATVQTQLENKATKSVYTITIPTTGWSETSPYSIEIAAEGILESDKNFPISPVYTIDNMDTIMEEWNKVSLIESQDNKIIIYCKEAIPTVEIPIQITVVR